MIEESGLFGETSALEEPVVHRVPAEDWISAWRSHATLQRQAGLLFDELVSDIEDILGKGELDVPYVTVGWTARPE
ncbi:hypothetical protein [Amycolatopsis alkalitolerans]|uniref:Uncharacterized protein n=1 Tax=Amycolatopsis alkalitolerans TaxID=2547244 RepID=A0A5C4MAL7_9PSEU|nr:hypothetical protein [Amycolatopsis alkalitolerans]TNC28530.1 hypothetical protein FG385_04450 [Amycolatopsis alkalitolerans]